jgi:carboxyl-terminal processing protease
MAAAIGVVVLGLAAAMASPKGKSPYEKISIFARVLSHLERLYVEPIDGQEVIYGAIRGMVRTLDPHSAFLLPDEFNILEEDTKGQFGGVGVEVGIRDDVLTVITPISGSPAEKAGITPRDQIIAVEGRPTHAMGLVELVGLMRGKPGTKVTITLKREGIDKPFEVTLVREIIQIESVRAELLAPGFPWIQVSMFQQGTTADVSREIQRLIGKGHRLKGIVLDLRRNPGGLFDEAVRLSDLFIDRGVLVTTRGRNGQIIQSFKAGQEGTLAKTPVVALIDGASASAAEIVAGALQDRGRALLVGARSFGKGSVQSIIDLGDGYGLKLTVARYFTPKGRSIQVDGVQPDVVIESRTAPAPGEESQLIDDVAGEGDLPGHLPPDGPLTAKEDSGSIADYQLRIAYQLLRGLARAERAQTRGKR